jgi:membrane protease YdiL (CAAX protease family)
MIGHLRVKSPWSQLGLCLGLLGAGLALTSIVLAFIVHSRGLPVASMDKLDWSRPRVLATMKLVQAVSSITIFLIPALFYSLIVFSGKRLYFLGIRPPVKPQMYLMCILCMVIAIPFVLWLGDLNQRVPLPQWMTNMEKDAGQKMIQFLKAHNTLDVVMNVFIIAFLPALCEELFFRGVLQRIIINICKNPLAGIIVTAILFSAAHMQFQGFLPRMFLGMVLGALFWYSGSLWTSILAHFVNNAVQVVAVSYAPEYIDKNPSLPIFMALASGAAVAGILWVYRSFSTITYEKVYEPDRLNRGNEFLA